MADLSKITLPNGDTYDLKDGIRGVEFIVGTQTAATGSWTGKTNRAALFDGMQIKYFLPYAGSGNATLNLTLSGGSTTGAKPIYRWGTTSATTHFKANSVVDLTYSTKAVGTGTWYVSSQYDDGNTYDRNYLTAATVKCGSTAIASGNIIVGDSTGLYKHLKLGTAFDITYPILFANAAIAANANSGGSNYTNIPFTVTTTQSITLTFPAAVYIKGQLSGTLFTPVSTTPLTQTRPTTDDGYEYIYLGQAYSASTMYLMDNNPIFAHRNGVWRELTGDHTSVAAGNCDMQYNSTTQALDFVFS